MNIESVFPSVESIVVCWLDNSAEEKKTPYHGYNLELPGL